jgi:acyl-coenzyme A thioesterase PaaI-like protein
MTSRAQRLPRDPEFEARVRASFERQRFMTLLGARLSTIVPGVVEIELPVADELTQQNGFLHAGVLLAALDTACGYAALTLMPAKPRHASGGTATSRRGTGATGT